MDSDDFEGTLVLEKMTEIGELDAFWEAIDNDDFQTAMALMKKAGLDRETIAEVLKQMSEGT